MSEEIGGLGEDAVTKMCINHVSYILGDLIKFWPIKVVALNFRNLGCSHVC